MGSRPRIRWEHVAKLGAGAIVCAALLVGLPDLLERPQPPPLEPDIGLLPTSASRAGIPRVSRRDHARRRPEARDHATTRKAHHADGRTLPAGHRSHRHPVALSDGAGAAGPAPPLLAPASAQTVDAAPQQATSRPSIAPSPPEPPAPRAAAPTPSAPPPSEPPEFGFEH